MLTAATTTPKLRIGLLLNSTSVPAWVMLMLKRISASSYAELTLIVIAEPAVATVPETAKFRHLLYRQYMSYEKLRFSVLPDAFAPSDLSPLVADLPKLKLTLHAAPQTESFGAADLEKVRGYDLDVLLDLGLGHLRGGILKAAKAGAWSYQHGDNQMRRGGPAGFWEVFHGEPITGAALHNLADDPDNEQVLAKTFSSTDAMLVKQSLNTLYWKALSLMPRQLETLHRLGHQAFAAKLKHDNKNPRFYTGPHFCVPTNREFLPLLVRHFIKYFKRRIYNLIYFHQWILMFDFRDGISSAFWRFKSIIPPRDRFWADPFVVLRDGKYYVFIEELLFSKPQAHISVFTINEKGEHSVPVPVLERPYHLSYPFLFQWKGVDYMIPETLENGAIELYRCNEFPGKWVFDRTLIGGIRAADVTLFEHAGKWWLFANVVENVGASSWDELFLYYADSPDSTDWTPHPLNPIVSDARRARPAGKVFRYGDELYRPGQDCGTGYGSGIRTHRILKLTETEYEEVEVGRIEPHWDSSLVGVHTLSRDGRLTVIDTNKRRNRYFG